MCIGLLLLGEDNVKHIYKSFLPECWFRILCYAWPVTGERKALDIIFKINSYYHYPVFGLRLYVITLITLQHCDIALVCARRLCARDSHQLYQRLESHAIDYIVEVKRKLLQQLTSGHSTPEEAKAFMSLLLEEYTALCTSSKILSEIFKQLVGLLLMALHLSDSAQRLRA